MPGRPDERYKAALAFPSGLHEDGFIVAGRLPLSEWDATVKKSRAGGGDRMAEEFAKDHAAST